MTTHSPAAQQAVAATISASLQLADIVQDVAARLHDLIACEGLSRSMVNSDRTALLPHHQCHQILARY